MHNEEVMDYFLQIVAEEFGITVKQLTDRGRKGNIVDARRIFCYLSRNYTSAFLIDIGKKLNRDHTSVIHLIKSANDYLSYDDNLIDTLKRLEAKSTFTINLKQRHSIISMLKGINDDQLSQVENFLNQLLIAS